MTRLTEELTAVATARTQCVANEIVLILVLSQKLLKGRPIVVQKHSRGTFMDSISLIVR